VQSFPTPRLMENALSLREVQGAHSSRELSEPQIPRNYEECLFRKEFSYCDDNVVINLSYYIVGSRSELQGCGTSMLVKSRARDMQRDFHAKPYYRNVRCLSLSFIEIVGTIAERRTVQLSLAKSSKKFAMETKRSSPRILTYNARAN